MNTNRTVISPLSILIIICTSIVLMATCVSAGFVFGREYERLISSEVVRKEGELAGKVELVQFMLPCIMDLGDDESIIKCITVSDVAIFQVLSAEGDKRSLALRVKRP